MKRIFLTSGLVLCMACPAFAAGFTTNEISGGQPDPDTGEITIGEACDQAHLDTFSGASTLQAIWNPLSGAVFLDDDYYYAAASTATYTATRDATPDPLYTVFGYNGGTGSTAGQGVFSDSNHSTAVSQLTLTPTMKGYTFAGFNSAKNGTGVSYISSVGAIDPSLADFGNGSGGTLYAQWTPIQYTISYNVGSIPGSASTPSAPSSETVTFDLGLDGQAHSFASPLTADGYTFVGWKTDTDLATGTSGDTTYGNASSGGSIARYQTDSDKTLTAQWTPWTYSVQYSCGGGSARTGAGAVGVPSTATNIAYNSQYTFASNDDTTGCYKSGYHFTGWSCSNGVGSHATTCSSTGGTHSCTGDTVNNWQYANIADGTTVMCEAQYTANEIGLTFNYDNGTSSTSGTCDYGDEITLPETPTKTGYQFGGWQVTSTSGDQALGDNNGH